MADKNTPYDEGCNAWWSGRGIESNPYKEHAQRSQWIEFRDGWIDTNNECDAEEESDNV